MRILSKFVGIMALLLGSQLAFAQTEAEVVQMLDKAVKLLTDTGDEGLKAINKKGGDFDKGELYAFVYDENVVMLANPAKPALVGKSLKGMPDVRGKFYRDEIVAKALNGGGWVDYDYQKPGATGIFKKRVLCKLAINNGKKYIVIVGMYSDK